MGKNPLKKVKTLQEFIEVLDSEEGKSFLHYQIDNEDFYLQYSLISCGVAKHIIFYDEQFVNKFLSCELWYLDATYKAVIKFSKNTQLLTIMGKMYGKVSIIVYCVPRA